MPTFRDINQFNSVSQEEVNPDWALQISSTQKVTLRQIANLYTNNLQPLKLILGTNKPISYDTREIAEVEITPEKIGVTPEKIGAAKSKHTHIASDIQSPGSLTVKPPLVDGQSLLPNLIYHSNLSSTTVDLTMANLGMFSRMVKYGRFSAKDSSNVDTDFLDVWLTTILDLQGIRFIFQFELLKDINFNTDGNSKKFIKTLNITLTYNPDADLVLFEGQGTNKFLKYIGDRLCVRPIFKRRSVYSPLTALSGSLSDRVSYGSAFVHLYPDDRIDWSEEGETLLVFDVGIHLDPDVSRLYKDLSDGLPSVYNQLQMFIPYADLGISIS